MTRPRLAAALLLTCCALQAAGPLRAQRLREDLRAQVEEEVLAAEKQLEQAIEKRDVAAVGRLTSDRLIDANQFGATMNKSRFIEWLQTTRDLPTITLQNAQVM